MFNIFVEKTMNPFIIKGYAGKNYFCDRATETDRLYNALLNQRDITLISLRKMGKTGLIFHLFDLLKKKGTHDTLYLDILHTQNLNGLINQLATSVVRLKKPFGKKMMEFLAGMRYLRPVISVDPLTGLPAVSMQMAGEKEAQATLHDLFIMLADRGSKIPLVIAIDEFQQINNYPEKSTEALLRGIMQSLAGVTFIFSGSNKTMLTRMFGDTSRPFYQSTEMVFLEEIGEELYLPFITKHFSGAGRRVDRDVVRELLHWTRCHTWYVQYACNRIFESGLACDEDVKKNIIPDILLGFEPFYLEYQSLVTRHQWQLLKAIAHSGSVSSITSGDFIRKYSLTNASTVKRGIDTLLLKELIYQKEGQYLIYDVFFSRWLELREI